MRKPTLLAIAIVIGASVPRHSEARVIRLAVEQTRRIADGKNFGTVGPYERIDGTVFMEVDPRDPLNAVIVNLDKAPKNAKGIVEFSAPFFILKPVDMSRGNHKLFYGVNNRGNDIEITWRTFLPASRRGPFSTSQPHLNNNPFDADDFGDGLLLRLGYTYVDAGWQGNVTPEGNRLVPTFPVALGANGQPISGLIRVQYADADGYSRPLAGSQMFRSYETVDTDPRHSTLRRRSAIGGASEPVAPDQWAFGQCPTGKASLVATKTDICLYEGFRSDQTYELTYPAKNPIVMGLGYTVTRDLASFLRYTVRCYAGNRNPLAASGDSVELRRSYASGISSTGMYMRDWLYLGFNEDEKHRKVFDAEAVFPAIPEVTFPTVVNELSLPNFGPQFQPSGGRLTEFPPTLGARYEVLVPKPDKDGFDIVGIRPMEVAAPIGTITGWNVRAADHGAPDLCGLSGSFIPFATTKVDRVAQGDPRPSLEERYRDHDGFVRAVEAASRRLIKDRFLLQEDADQYIQAAKNSDILRQRD
jgi:hypothetical protein